MIKSIEYCFRNKVIATFSDESNRLLVGFVENYNDSEILISHISPRGCYDGFVLKRIEDICRIDYGGEYEKKIERLYHLKRQKHSLINLTDPEEEIFYSLLDFAKQSDYIISLELEETRISGFVNGYVDDIIYLDVVNDYGTENGISIIKATEVLTVAIDSDHEQDLKLLAQV